MQSQSWNEAAPMIEKMEENYTDTPSYRQQNWMLIFSYSFVEINFILQSECIFQNSNYISIPEKLFPRFL